MKIDFDVITLRGCLMCFWQYKMDRNGGWCWSEDTVVSWTLSQTENGKIKAQTINVLSRSEPQEKIDIMVFWCWRLQKIQRAFITFS